MKKRFLSCKRLVILTVLLIILVGVAAGGLYIYYLQQISTPLNPAGQEVTFTVKSGQTSQVATELQTAGLISNDLIFRAYLKLTALDDQIKAGDFKLSSKLSMQQIAAKLIEAPNQKQITVLIKEGQRFTELLADIKPQLAKGDVLLDDDVLTDIFTNPNSYTDKFSATTQEFLSKYLPDEKTLEGFLYPDTYFVDTNIREVELIDLLVKTLAVKLTSTDYAQIVSSDYSMHEILTMASIVEWEANNDVDYPIVAGVFYSRLDRGMNLGADATVLYGLNRRKPEPTKSELASTTNKYNSRALTGLPPTPIGNAGIATIRAALNPTKTDYLYYITGKDGKMYYAKTLSEHNKNISNHLN